MNIFVAKLNYDTHEDDIRAAFEEFGEVTSANVIMDKFTGRSKGFAFVEMSNQAEAEAAVKALDGHSVEGRQIAVNPAKPPRSRERRY